MPGSMPAPAGSNLILVLVLLFTPPALLAANAPALCFRNVQVGEAIPDCSVETNGGTTSLGELTSGRVVVLLFIRGTKQGWRDALRDTEWACSEQSRPVEGLALLARNGPMEEVDSFIAAEGLRLKVLRETDCFSAFGVLPSPTAAIVNEEGILVYTHPGYRYGFGDSLRANVAGVLAGKLSVATRERGTEEFYQGLRLKKQARIHEALSMFQQAAREKPDFADGRFHYGLLLIDTGSLKEGAAELEAVVALEPGHALAFEKLGEVRFMLGEMEESQTALEECLHLSPRSLLAKAVLAGVFVNKGMLEKGRIQAEAALALNPLLPLAHYWLGRVHESQGRTEEAIREYKMALKSILEEED